MWSYTERRLTFWPIFLIPHQYIFLHFLAVNPKNCPQNKHNLQNHQAVTTPLKINQTNLIIYIFVWSHEQRSYILTKAKKVKTNYSHKMRRRFLIHQSQFDLLNLSLILYCWLTWWQVRYFRNEKLLSQVSDLIMLVQIFCHHARRGATAKLLWDPHDRLPWTLHTECFITQIKPVSNWCNL